MRCARSPAVSSSTTSPTAPATSRRATASASLTTTAGARTSARSMPRVSATAYMVSTYSLPASVVAPRGDQGALHLPAPRPPPAPTPSATAASAFAAPRARSFPARPSRSGRSRSSAPARSRVADPATAKIGYQIAGPYPCQRSFFKNCGSEVANTQTAATHLCRCANRHRTHFDPLARRQRPAAQPLHRHSPWPARPCVALISHSSRWGQVVAIGVSGCAPHSAHEPP